MGIPKWVWGVLVVALVVGQVLHWVALAKVSQQLDELTGGTE